MNISVRRRARVVLFGLAVFLFNVGAALVAPTAAQAVPGYCVGAKERPAGSVEVCTP